MFWLFDFTAVCTTIWSSKVGWSRIHRTRFRYARSHAARDSARSWKRPAHQRNHHGYVVARAVRGKRRDPRKRRSVRQRHRKGWTRNNAFSDPNVSQRTLRTSRVHVTQPVGTARFCRVSHPVRDDRVSGDYSAQRCRRRNRCRAQSRTPQGRWSIARDRTNRLRLRSTRLSAAQTFIVGNLRANRTALPMLTCTVLAQADHFFSDRRQRTRCIDRHLHSHWSRENHRPCLFGRNHLGEIALGGREEFSNLFFSRPSRLQNVRFSNMFLKTFLFCYFLAEFSIFSSAYVHRGTS